MVGVVQMVVVILLPHRRCGGLVIYELARRVNLFVMYCSVSYLAFTNVYEVRVAMCWCAEK